MTKISITSIASICALSITGCAFAAPITTPSETDITASYAVSSTYNIEIPAYIEFAGATAPYNADITVSDTLLELGDQLKVSMTSLNGKLTNGSSSYINYDINYGGKNIEVDMNTTYVLLKVQPGEIDTSTAQLSLTPKGLDNVTIAGRHADTLTFTVEVTNAPTFTMLNAPTAYTNANESLIFRSEAPIDTFEHFDIDGETIPSDKYSLTEGSTVITLSSYYSQTISKGNHNAKIYSTGGYAEADFIKNFEAMTPVLFMQDIANIKKTMKTGDQIQLADKDDNNKLYWVGMFADGNVWMTQNYDNRTESFMPSSDVYFANGNALTGTSLNGLPANSELRHYSDGSYYTWDTAQDICPQGWEIPSQSQYENLLSQNIISKDNILSAPFYGVLAGYVFYDNSGHQVDFIGSESVYWATGDDGYAKGSCLRIGNEYAYATRDWKDDEASVRCVAK